MKDRNYGSEAERQACLVDPLFVVNILPPSQERIVLGWGTTIKTGAKRPAYPYSRVLLPHPDSAPPSSPMLSSSISATSTLTPVRRTILARGPRPSSPGAPPTLLGTAPDLHAGGKEKATPRAKNKRQSRGGEEEVEAVVDHRPLSLAPAHPSRI